MEEDKEKKPSAPSCLPPLPLFWSQGSRLFDGVFQETWGTGRLLHVGLRPLGSRQGGTRPDSELGARARGRDSVPGNGQEAPLHRPLKIKQEPAGPGRSICSPQSCREPRSFPSASRTPEGAVGEQPERGRPQDWTGTRTWAFGTPAPRPSHPHSPRPRPGLAAEVPREASPERGRVGARGRGRGAGPARSLTHGWRRAGGARAPRGRVEPVAQVCRSGGHVRGPGSGRAALGCCWASGWLLVPGSWLPGRGGSVARLRLHWGPAARRGALTSAPGALRAGSRARTRHRRPEAAGQARGFPLGAPGEHLGTRKPEKPLRAWGERGVGF